MSRHQRPEFKQKKFRLWGPPKPRKPKPEKKPGIYSIFNQGKS